MESLLREYPISSAEGLALMRLAEALLRVPDAETAIALTADQLGRADFDGAAEGSPHKLLAGPVGQRIAPVQAFLPGGWKPARADRPPGRADRGGRHGARHPAAGPPVRAGPDHRRGAGRGRSARRQRPQLRFSYDMLGEGRAHRCRRAALPGLATRCAPSQPSRRRPRPPGRARRHLDQAQRAAPALRGSAARPRARRTGAARVGADRPGRARQHQPHHRRRGSDRLELSLDRLRGAGRPCGASHPQWPASAWPCRPTRPARCELMIDAVAAIGARVGCASWCAWSRAPTGTARSSARRSWAWPATRCSPTSTTPTSATWPARRRCSAMPT
jgi:RHH-type proline utilization regulon transcriptional repressor/proline dehydrogenase/delta 1-pyrroline-5-carboxylate dehydrogenase